MTEQQVPPNRLALLRERSKLSQSEVSKMLEMSVSTISRHENSSRGLTRDVLIKYARLYKVTSAEIFIELEEEDTATGAE